jgi:AcrR family transcriptional regulator
VTAGGVGRTAPRAVGSGATPSGAAPAEGGQRAASSAVARPTAARSADTRRRLIAGAIETLRTHGIAASSARAIAASSGVNQALIFYHFGSVENLVDVACRDTTADRVALYRDRFASVGSLRELLRLGRELHVAERAAGNVTALAQVLAGAQQDERLAAAARDALGLWIAEIQSTLVRLTTGSPIAEVADPAGLAQGVAAAFIGIELYEGVNPGGAAAALDTLEQLALLTEVIEDLGPIARRALRARIRRTARTARAAGSSRIDCGSSRVDF